MSYLNHFTEVQPFLYTGCVIHFRRTRDGDLEKGVFMGFDFDCRIRQRKFIDQFSKRDYDISCKKCIGRIMLAGVNEPVCLNNVEGSFIYKIEKDPDFLSIEEMTI